MMLSLVYPSRPAEKAHQFLHSLLVHVIDGQLEMNSFAKMGPRKINSFASTTAQERRWSPQIPC